MPREHDTTLITPQAIAEHGRQLESAHPRAILEWTLELFPGEVGIH